MYLLWPTDLDISLGHRLSLLFIPRTGPCLLSGVSFALDGKFTENSGGYTACHEKKSLFGNDKHDKDVYVYV